MRILFDQMAEKKDAQRPPLHQAILAGNLEDVRTLVAKGADLLETSVGGMTAMHMAVRSGQIDMLDFLMSTRASALIDTPAKPAASHTPMHMAASAGDVAMMERLISYGVSLSIATEGNRSMIDIICGGVKNAERAVAALRLLRDNGLTAAKIMRYSGETPLHVAAQAGNLAALQFLVEEEGLDIAARGSKNMTPLHHAVLGRSENCAAYLIKAGADTNAKDASGTAPLHLAVEARHEPLVMHLLRSGANPDQQNNRGMTPLMLARGPHTGRIADALRKAMPRPSTQRRRALRVSRGHKTDTTRSYRRFRP